MPVTLYSISNGKALTVGSKAYNTLQKRLKSGELSADDYADKVFGIRFRSKTQTPLTKSHILGKITSISPSSGQRGEEKREEKQEEKQEAPSSPSKTSRQRRKEASEQRRITIKKPKAKEPSQEAGAGGAGASAGAGNQVENRPMNPSSHPPADPPKMPEANHIRKPDKKQQPDGAPSLSSTPDRGVGDKAGAGASAGVSVGAGGEAGSVNRQLFPSAGGGAGGGADGDADQKQGDQPPSAGVVSEEKAVEEISQQQGSVVSKGLELRLIGKDSDEELRKAKVLYRELIDKLFVSHSFLRLQEMCLAKPELKKELKGKPVDLFNRAEFIVKQYQDQLGLKELLYGVDADLKILKKQLVELYTCAKHIRSTLGKQNKNDALSQFNKVGVIVSASSMGLTLNSLLEWAKQHGSDGNDTVPHGLKGFGDVPDLSSLAVNKKESKVLKMPDGNIRMRIEKVYEEPTGKEAPEDKDVKKINYRDVRYKTTELIRSKKAKKRVSL